MPPQKSRGLTDRQKADIRQLETVCNRFEGLTMKLNWNTLQNRSDGAINDFLHYEGGLLVGYLALYAFNRREAEVSAMVHPDYRRQGIFNQLLQLAAIELQRRHTPDFLFICERASRSGPLCMQAIGAEYEFSEYKMELGELRRPDRQRADLEFRPARPPDINDLARMEHLCFELPLDDARERMKRDLVDSSRFTLIATRHNNQIGKIGILTGESETYIVAFCVLPEHQGQGYGRTILAHTVEQLIAARRPNIRLEVACENERALNLYKGCGFQVSAAYDYYRLPVSDLNLAASRL